MRNKQTIDRSVLLIVGNNIQAIRKRRKLTQAQLGDALNLTRASIINIEQGRHACTIEGIIKLVSVLGCRYTDILRRAVKEAQGCKKRKRREDEKDFEDSRQG